MNFNNYTFNNSKLLTKLMLFVGVFIFASQTQTWAQSKILANEVTYTSGNKPLSTTPTVQNPNNALVDDDNYARLLASPGVALGIGTYKGVIELKFENTLPADTWSYVRMEGDFNLFRALLGGSLGNVLGDVLGAVLVGNQEIIIDARMGSTSVLSRSSTLGFGTDRVKLMQDGDGNNYLAIRPASDYDRLRITNQTGSLLGLGVEKTLDVYSAFYYEDTGNDCDRPFATSFDGGGGIGLEVGDLNDQNLGNAIDDDENSFSRLKSSSVLNVNVASTLSQYFYFPTVSAETTTANIKLALGSGGLVNTDLLGAIEIIFFEDNTIVSRRSLQSSLLNNTNALTLLDSGDPVTLTFAPGKAFDRIAIKLNSPVGVNLLGNGVKIYDVQRYDDIAGCPNPLIAALPPATDDPFETASCASGLIDFDNVDFAHRTVDGNNESYATLFADAGNLLVSGPTAGFIEMDLGQAVPANKTTYVRINYDEDVLDRLVGGSLGKLVGDLANSLLLGNQYFEVEAKNGTNTVLSRSSSNAFEGTSNGAVTLVQDNIGRYYIAITPNADYNRVRITNHVVALLSTGKKASLDVYNACFEIGTNPCFPANFTSYRGGGLGLNVGNISSVGVTNAYRAISENSSEYSEINLGVAGLLAHVYQTVYFSQPSQVGDKVKIKIALEPSSALSLDVLGRYRIKFFNGATQVGNDETLESGLINNLDLLALFGSGGMVELEYEPNGIFDRVEIGAESIASVNVAAEPLRLYSVERYGDTCPLTKTPFPFEVPSCSTTLVDAHNADNVQNLFDDDFDSYATLKSGAGILFGLGNKHEGYVEMGYDQPMSAGTTSYIRIDFEETILDGLLGGSLGNVVSGLLDNLILGDHFFRVDVKDANSNIIHTASSNAASAGGGDAIRVVQDAAGRYYIAVTPTSDFQSVRITDATNSLLGLLAQPNTMNVYGMCTDRVTDPCFGPFATSYEHSGLSLSVNDLGGAGVTNMSYAINGNTTNYSEISNGTLGVGASTKQWIYFNSVSGENDIARIQFKTEGGVVDADILGGLEIKAYLANDEVYSVSSQNGLINGINVADLLTNNEMVTLDISPGQSFDRISVGIKTLVGVAVFPPVHLYGVERVCDLPPTNSLICTEEVSGEAFSWSENGGSGTVTKTITQPGVNGGFQFDIYELDNSFNMEINGVKLAEYEIEFQSNGTPAPGINIEFEDGDQYEADTEGSIWQMRGSTERPLIRVQISPLGEVSMYGSKTSGGILYPLQFKQNISPINYFNSIQWNTDSINTIVVTQNIVGATLMDGYGTGRNIIPCKTYTLEKDGVFNDENGDGIAQVGESITYILTVKNAGDIDIYNLQVEDIMLGGEITTLPTGDQNNDGILNISEVWVYTVDYLIIQNDVNNRGVYNLASVSGDNVLDESLSPETSIDPTPLDPNDSNYDPNKPNHTFVPLKGQSLLITNPHIYHKMKNN
ncbi:hypothetical protein [Oceanihabitans sediminis]|uniref:DUF7507 domain-containing protein n=1 Tax=Oceanihabitans sediminis TaxID=1812012 RepID=UPI003A92455C